jgi:osmotically-inducible protein OsmY
MSNEELTRYVTEELHWDPKVDGPAIAVSTNDGVVTLRGTVGSFREKRDAKQSAERVYGVKRVENGLDVRPLNEDRRSGAELRGAVLQALALDGVVPSTIDAKVDDGRVTLTGTATWKHQQNEAAFVAGNVWGVTDVDDDIELVPPPPTVHEIEHDIEKAMKRNARLDAESVSVQSENGTVTLRGTVSSWADHDQAVDAAWAAPGVKRVNDHILVLY